MATIEIPITTGIGVSGRRYMDYNRWNGTDVRKYFGYDTVIPDPPEELTLASLDKRLKIIEEIVL